MKVLFELTLSAPFSVNSHSTVKFKAAHEHTHHDTEPSRGPCHQYYLKEILKHAELHLFLGKRLVQIKHWVEKCILFLVH